MVWRMFIGILCRRMLLLMVGFLLVAGVGIDDLAIDLDAPYGNVKSDKPPFLALRELFALGDLTHTSFIKQESNDLRNVALLRFGTENFVRSLVASFAGNREAAGLINPCPTIHFPQALKSTIGLDGFAFLD